VILAGGEGTRLRPLTLTRPKPVVPLLGHPFLAYQLALLREHGVADVTLACSYRVEDVRRACGDGSAFGVRLHYAIEAVPLGTGGGVRNAITPDAGALWVLNGDVLTDADLTAAWRFHADRGARATIVLTRVGDPRPYGLVETEARGRVRGFREKPERDEDITTDTINAGIYLLDGALLERIPTGRPVSIEREFFPALVTDGVPFFAWCEPAYWRDIGSPIAYRDAQADLLLARVRTPLAPLGVVKDGSRIGAGTTCASDARVLAPSMLGAGVALAPRAQVGPLAVIGDGCRIGDGARVERSVLWEGVEVGAGAVVRDSVLADGVKVAAGAEIGPGAAVAAGTVVTPGGGPPR
jgi:NDP-sugar pyrophosphorylase family protein